MQWQVVRCCKCSATFAVTDDFYRVAMERCEQFLFYCPNGHEQHYVRGQSEIDKVRQERDRLKQQIAAKNDEIAHERRRVAAARGQVSRLTRRLKAGLCPCCNRSFQNLARHMSTKHPDFESKSAHEAA